jgi:hypothetical protein
MRILKEITAALPLLALAGLAFTGCAAQGRLVDLDSGEEIRLEMKSSWRGSEVVAVMEDGRRARVEYSEIMSVVENSPRRRQQGAAMADTMYHGSGYIKDGNRIIDFEYHRSPGSNSAVGRATDNHGRRYKLLF